MGSIIATLSFVVNDFSTIHFYKNFLKPYCAPFATSNGFKLRSTALPSLTLQAPRWGKGLSNLVFSLVVRRLFFCEKIFSALRLKKPPTLSRRTPPILRDLFFQPAILSQTRSLESDAATKRILHGMPVSSVA